eukprot:9495637-Pyramimonas_sp.AAC.1
MARMGGRRRKLFPAHVATSETVTKPKHSENCFKQGRDSGLNCDVVSPGDLWAGCAAAQNEFAAARMGQRQQEI